MFDGRKMDFLSFSDPKFRGIRLHQDACGITERITQIGFSIRIQLGPAERLRRRLRFITKPV